MILIYSKQFIELIEALNIMYGNGYRTSYIAMCNY